MTTWIRKLEQGITGGALATLPMSAVMVGAQRLGLLGKHPPEKITQAMLFGIGARPSRGQRKLLAVAAHFGFGAATGAVFSLARPGEPTLLRAALEGAAFGTAVWATSYIGLVPKLGIMPPPRRGPPRGRGAGATGRRDRHARRRDRSPGAGARRLILRRGASRKRCADVTGASAGTAACPAA
jgi:hypothetical protein